MSNVNIKKSYYASLCFYGLKQLGLIGGKTNPKYEQNTKKLETLGKEFAFCPPSAGGPIFTLVYQIPSYLDPTSVSELEKINHVLIQFIKNESIHSFQDIYPKKTIYWDKWYTKSWLNYLFKNIRKNKEKVIDIVNYFHEFLIKLWPHYLHEYHQLLNHYNMKDYESKCRTLNVFSKWEQVLNMKYPYDEFNLIICPESYTTASSLGPQKIVFGSCHSWDVMKNALIHEVGVRFMNLHLLSTHPDTSDIMEKDYFGIIKLIETEVCFQKSKLLPGLEADPFISGMKLEELIDYRMTQKNYDTVPSLFKKMYKEAKIKKITL